jgi:SOS response regulatory protein OraA/RecX
LDFGFANWGRLILFLALKRLIISTFVCFLLPLPCLCGKNARMFKKRNWRTPKPRKDSDEEEKPREINPEKARAKTFDRAVNLLAFKPRSVKELRERLLEKTWTNEEIVDAVLEKLKEYNYLNDEQFAKDFAASKLRGKPMGKRVLQQKLAMKKLDKETVKEAVENAYEETPRSRNNQPSRPQKTAFERQTGNARRR